MLPGASELEPIQDDGEISPSSLPLNDSSEVVSLENLAAQHGGNIEGLSAENEQDTVPGSLKDANNSSGTSSFANLNTAREYLRAALYDLDYFVVKDRQRFQEAIAMVVEAQPQEATGKVVSTLSLPTKLGMFFKQSRYMAEESYWAGSTKYMIFGVTGYKERAETRSVPVKRFRFLPKFFFPKFVQEVIPLEPEMIKKHTGDLHIDPPKSYTDSSILRGYEMVSREKYWVLEVGDKEYAEKMQVLAEQLAAGFPQVTIEVRIGRS